MTGGKLVGALFQIFFVLALAYFAGKSRRGDVVRMRAGN
jgi:hypothetical protein